MIVDAPVPPKDVDDNDVIAAVPKTMQTKAKRLMERLKKDVAGTDRGELIHDGVPVPGSNMTDLVSDLLKKSDPVGWQRFAQQLRRINLPMDLSGNVDIRRYLRQASTPFTPRSRIPRWTPLTRRHMARSRTTLDDWGAY